MMLYEIEYTRTIEGEPDVFTVIVEAPAFRVVRGGEVRFHDRLLRFVFERGHADRAHTATIGTYRPVTIGRQGFEGSAIRSELAEFNLAGMRESMRKLSEVTR